jgi:uncharacterized spore protein YtfJ
MDVDQVLEKARADMRAGLVFGEPIERDGVTVIPAAKIAGGGGAGSDDASDGGGGGGGFGLSARPAGALIIEPGGNVRWKGYLDLNRVVLGGQIVGLVLVLSLWLIGRSKASQR